jgi:hypothetical protein
MLRNLSNMAAIAALLAVTVSDFAEARGGRGMARGGGGSVGVHRNVNANRNVNVNRNVNANRNVNVNRNVSVNRNARVGVAVGVVRPWVRRPYFGTVVGGVALGTLIAMSAVPPVPAPGLCWYWADASQTQGYWDYCQ